MIYFLASLPRSGSTLLASLLNQRPDTFASTTSNLGATMGAAVAAWESDPATAASGDCPEDIFPILHGMAENRYQNQDKKWIFDKGRGWVNPVVMKTMIEVQGDVKIVATVRPVAECLASFVKISSPDNVREFCKSSPLAQHLFDCYKMLKAGYEAYPGRFLFIEYGDLMDDCQHQMNRISDFIGAPIHAHDMADVPPSGEIDEAWGIEGLHNVRSVVGRQEYRAQRVLGDELFDFYQGGEFWNDNPDPVRDVDPLDTQLEASIRGDFETAETLINQLRIVRPDCNRVAFNTGLYELRKGNLQLGHKLLDRGRDENVFGNSPISNRPVWTGEPGTVLLHMEGGLGDQIKSYRYAFDIQARGNRVVVACSEQLAPMFAENFITVQHEALGGVYHDYYVLSMSAVIPLGHSYETLIGEPYIKTTAEPIAGRVGVRWQGNPKFEHEQHRKFPPQLLFDAVQGLDCVSLQRDEGAELKPDWMAQADVSDWAATRKSIGECEIVITSCTSIAHLAGAMGIEVWIILPILPYYLWALPGNKSPYYDSVTLFRQEKYGDWSGPFKNIKEQLKCYMHTLKKAA